MYDDPNHLRHLTFARSSGLQPYHFRDARRERLRVIGAVLLAVAGTLTIAAAVLLLP